MPPLPPLFMTYHDVTNPKCKHQWYSKSKHGALFLRSILQLLDLYQAVLCIPPYRFQFGLGYDFRIKMFIFLYLLKCVSTLITDFCSYSVPELFQLQLLLSSNSFTENISKALDIKEDVQDNPKGIAVSGMTSRSIDILVFLFMILRFHKSSQPTD